LEHFEFFISKFGVFWAVLWVKLEHFWAVFISKIGAFLAVLWVKLEHFGAVLWVKLEHFGAISGVLVVNGCHSSKK
jgi:hypothetical protein